MFYVVHYKLLNRITERWRVRRKTWW